MSCPIETPYLVSCLFGQATELLAFVVIKGERELQIGVGRVDAA